MRKPLTILHLIPTLEVGGAERQLSLLAAEQVRLGHNVHIAIRRDGEYGAMLRERGVFIHVLGDYRSIDLRLLLRINKLITTIKPTIVQTWLPQMDLIAGVVALFRRIKWIATERASSEAYINDGILFQNYVRKIAIRRSSALVANSVGGESYWRDILRKTNKLFIIRNAIDHSSINSSIIDMNWQSDGHATILLVGRLIPSKAFDVVLNAVSLIPEVIAFRIKLIGQGPFRDSIIDIIHKLKLEKRVEVVGNVNWWSHMANAAMLISMSRFEGQPNVVLEAMAGNCPLIVSNIPAHKEILDDETAVFVPIDEPAELAIAIQAVLDNPKMARMRAAKARERTETMTIENVANSYDFIYKFALEGKK